MTEGQQLSCSIPEVISAGRLPKCLIFSPVVAKSTFTIKLQEQNLENLNTLPQSLLLCSRELGRVMFEMLRRSLRLRLGLRFLLSVCCLGCSSSSCPCSRLLLLLQYTDAEIMQIYYFFVFNTFYSITTHLLIKRSICIHPPAIKASIAPIYYLPSNIYSLFFYHYYILQLFSRTNLSASRKCLERNRCFINALYVF